MHFKTKRQQEEFNDKKLSKRLKNILIACDNYSQFNFNKDILVTEIWRSPAEQLEIYSDKNKRSVHQLWRGADLRVWSYTNEQIELMKDFVNVNFEYGKGNFKSCLVHEVNAKNTSFGKHFHIQVKSEF